MKAKLLLILALAAFSSPLADAHHFVVATYLLDKTVVVEGTVDRFLLRNPHSYLQFRVPGKAGSAKVRTAEWGSAGQLGRAGITWDTIKPGDRVVVTGNPSRNPSERMVRMKSIRRPSDGWKWSETE